MAEKIDFTFKGKLADRHALDFYEAGRFQYGASRLMVKLDQFRRTGRFSSRITYDNNTRILLETQEDGSFIISTLVPFLQAGGGDFISANLGTLWSYVADRVLGKTSTDDIRTALETQQQMLRVFDGQIANQANQNQQTLDMLKDRIAAGDQMTAQNTALYERLLAEKERSFRLQAEAGQLRKITSEQDAQLVSMAAPLLKDMGVATRNSAKTLTIAANDDGGSRPIVFIDRKIAAEVDTSRVDDAAILILVRIVQYNVETGWGKLRTDEYAGLLSFNVPSDKKADVQAELIEALDRGGNQLDTYVEALFVRSPAGILKRMIVLAVHDIDDVEQG
jgi:hypothetical protein